METVKEYMQKPLYTFIAGLIIGLIIGLPILGWGLMPVKWTDASPADLQQSWKVDYLRMAVESFNKNQDQHLAVQRWNELGTAKDEVLQALQNDPKLVQQDVSNFAMVVKSAAAVAPAVPGAATSQPNSAMPQTTPVAPKPVAKPGANPLTPLLFLLLIAAAIAAAYYYFVIYKKKSPGTEPLVDNLQKIFKPRETEPVVPVAGTVMKNDPPIAQFLTTYSLGDDMYDDSFSIDSSTGEFLGECGAGISETIGVGDPKKVSAFEVWLFDKNDIQTVTKVLMSEYAFNDQASYQRLMAKGEPVLLEPEKHILLDTATLQLEVRVVDVTYGNGTMPGNSYVERMTLELAVWAKQ